MIHPDVEALAAVLPPPAEPQGIPTAEQWAKAEEQFGAHFPNDYKSFIEVYGAGALYEDDFDDFDIRLDIRDAKNRYFKHWDICRPFGVRDLNFIDNLKDFQVFLQSVRFQATIQRNSNLTLLTMGMSRYPLKQMALIRAGDPKRKNHGQCYFLTTKKNM